LKAIILAAGEGKRLRPLTENIPKSMVKLFGKPILKRQVNLFKKCGINEICVVRGYKKEEINLLDLKYYFNEKFDITNMVETLFCAKDEFNEALIISYGDIIYDKKVLEKLMKTKENFSIIIDKNWEKLWKIRFDNPLDDAESLKIDNNGYISDIGQKTKKIDEIEGQFIGLIKIQGDGLRILKSSYEKFREQAIKKKKNPLNPNLPFEKSYMTDFLQGLIKNNYKLTPVFVNNGWLEVDSIRDFEIYNKMFENKKILEFINLEDSN
jgi:L-glutamine-phosphate cytidylyltransferase